MKKNKISVGIIGAGVIGAGVIIKNNKPIFIKDINRSLSHSSFVDNSEKFLLNFILEKKLNIRKVLNKVYNCKILSSFKKIRKTECPDIISVCVQDHYHYKVLEQIIELKPKLVIIEKPISTDPVLSKKIINIYKKNNIKMVVNYSRRFVPFFKKLREQLRVQEILSAQVYYANGLLHNGCHIIDLFRILFGPITTYRALSYRDDFSSSDPTVSAFISTKNCKSCFMIGLDNRNYVHWEMKIFTNLYEYKIHGDHRKLTIKKIKSNVGNPPGKRLVHYKTKSISYDNALKNLYYNAKSMIESNLDWKEEIDSAFKAEFIAHSLLKQKKITAINNN